MLWFLSKSVFSAVMIRTCFFKILRFYNVLPVMSAWTRPLLRKACPSRGRGQGPLRTPSTLLEKPEHCGLGHTSRQGRSGGSHCLIKDRRGLWRPCSKASGGWAATPVRLGVSLCPVPPPSRGVGPKNVPVRWLTAQSQLPKNPTSDTTQIKNSFPLK